MDKYLPTGNKEIDSKLPGMDGVFNSSNLNLYSFTQLNPVRFTDPDGRLTQSERTKAIEVGRSHVAKEPAITNALMKPFHRSQTPVNSYMMGGKGDTFMDCSGLMGKIVPGLPMFGTRKQVGLRGTEIQHAATSYVNPDNVIPGDLVFFLDSKVKKQGHITSHVGLVSDVRRNDKGELTGYSLLHTTSSKGKTEEFIDLSSKTGRSGYFNQRFVGFRTLKPKTDPERPMSDTQLLQELF